MNYSNITRLFIIMMTPLLLAGETERHTAMPNVILIVTDDQGYGEVGANGNSSIHTPNMDELYMEGVRLEDFHVNNVCAPSRAALMTGKNAASVGVWHTLGGRNILSKEESTMGDHFKENGYKTCMVGKWHLGDNYPYRPEDRGFEEVFRIGGGSLGQVADYWNNGLWDGHYWDGERWVQTEGYCTDVQFDAAIEFIERSGSNPFFLYLATTAPHSPVGADQEYVAPYLKKGFDKKVAEFYGMVTNIDKNLGRLRSHLRKKSLAENTILIFMSDNGSACGKKDPDIFNGGMRGKKGSDYEGGHRVPCFFYWPDGGINGGRSIHELTAHIDLLPTLAEACKLQIPDTVNFEGINLLPFLAQNKQAGEWPERYLVTEGKVNNREKIFSSSCVMQEEWRLVAGEELYNIHLDPSQVNRTDDPGKTEEMKKKYLDWHNQVSISFKEEYCFQYHEDSDHIPYVSMDLLPFENKNQVMKTVWNQGGVKKGMKNTGYWNVAFPEEGTYQFVISRIPYEAIASPEQNLKEMDLIRASVWIDGEIRASTNLIEKEKTAIDLKLEKGRHKIAALLENTQGETFSAYYLYITRK